MLDPRYSRNTNALSVKDVHALHAAKVCVVGGGGLGGYIVEILARVGVHHITLVDYDVFEPNNLNRQLFCEEALINMHKADAAQQRVAKVNSNVKFSAVKEKLTIHNAARLIHGHNIVMDALDNIESRLILGNACSAQNIPMIHGSIAGWYGQVAVIFPGSNILDKLYCDIANEHGIERELGNLPFSASLVASLQCAECVKILTGKEAEYSVLQIDMLRGEFCKICAS